MIMGSYLDLGGIMALNSSKHVVYMKKSIMPCTIIQSPSHNLHSKSHGPGSSFGLTSPIVTANLHFILATLLVPVGTLLVRTNRRDSFRWLGQFESFNSRDVEYRRKYQYIIGISFYFLLFIFFEKKGYDLLKLEKAEDLSFRKPFQHV